MSKAVRVRFAPSPTGPLHIGGIRTALYNYLFAKKQKGTFILRIEDTDQARYVPGAEDYVIESLKWLGLEFDEGVGIGGSHLPYRQSERKPIYKQYAEFLLEKDLAYLAFDSSEELDAIRSEYELKKLTFKYDIQSRNSLKNSLSLSKEEVDSLMNSGAPYVIRIKIPENREIHFDDIIRGHVVFQSKELDDKVLFKSDGLPTYHLANVVDDYLMEISHVIRGEEWLPSAPLHVLLYEFLGWKDFMPEFAHMPLIMKPSGKGKLSKRDGDAGGFPVFPLEWKDPFSGEISSGYRESGYFPEAVINMLAFLGWNPGTEQELFTIDELIEEFSLIRVNKAGARFDPEKAKWFNHKYLQKKNIDELVNSFNDILRRHNIFASNDYVEKAVEMVKERANFLSDLWEDSWFLFKNPETFDQEVIKKRWKEDSSNMLLNLATLLSDIEDFTSEKIEVSIKSFIESKMLNFGQVMNLLRLCLVGSGKGPHLTDIISLIGKDEAIKRIRKAVEVIAA